MMFVKRLCVGEFNSLRAVDRTQVQTLRPSLFRRVFRVSAKVSPPPSLFTDFSKKMYGTKRIQIFIFDRNCSSGKVHQAHRDMSVMANEHAYWYKSEGTPLI